MERELGARIILFSMMSCSLLRVTRANMEGDVLNSLRASWIDPNNVLQSWNSTDVNPCSWFHVTCNYDNRVTRLDLGNANLSGQLIPQLGLLKNLQYLELLVTI